MKIIVVATVLTPPSEEQFKLFVEALLKDQVPGQIEIKGLAITDGPNCANYGFLLDGWDIENWANQFTEAAHGIWAYAEDHRGLLKEGQYVDLRTQHGHTVH